MYYMFQWIQEGRDPLSGSWVLTGEYKNREIAFATVKWSCDHGKICEIIAW